MSEVEDIISYVRDINLEMIMEDHDVDIDIRKRYNTKFRLFYPSRKLVKNVIKNGGVLVGSRAIRCYTMKGKPILERKVNDWDFIVTLDMAFKICDEMGITKIPKVGSVISVKNQRMWRHTYSDSYRVGPVDVQLIINDDLPDFKKVKGIRVGNFNDILSNKVSLISKLSDEDRVKHINDIKEIVIKFNNLKLNGNT